MIEPIGLTKDYAVYELNHLIERRVEKAQTINRAIALTAAVIEAVIQTVFSALSLSDTQSDTQADQSSDSNSNDNNYINPPSPENVLNCKKHIIEIDSTSPSGLICYGIGNLMFWLFSVRSLEKVRDLTKASDEISISNLCSVSDDIFLKNIVFQMDEGQQNEAKLKLGDRKFQELRGFRA